MSLKGLEKLKAWSKSMEFAMEVYREVLPVLPLEEKWGLNQQIRRSVQSIPANLAEGYGRYYYQENVRYCYIARGSLEETISHLALAHKLGYLPDPIYERLIQDGEEVTRIINGYISYLKKSRQGFNEPGAINSLGETSSVYNTEFENRNPDQ